MKKKQNTKKLNHGHTPYTKIKQKWPKDLDARLETLKHMKENLGKNFTTQDFCDAFLDSPQKSRGKRV